MRRSHPDPAYGGARRSVAQGLRWFQVPEACLWLPGEQRLDPGAQARPVRLRQVEMAAEIEEGDLADPTAGALGSDETERKIGFVGGFIPNCRFSYEHGVERGRGGARRQDSKLRLWHYIEKPTVTRLYIRIFPYSLHKVAGKLLKMG